MPALRRIAVPILVALATPTLAVITSDWDSLPGQHTQYDFVIAGGGNAGSVLANRLTENPHFKVLVIEAGPNYAGIQNMYIPGNAFSMSSSPYDWNFTCVPQVGLNGRSKRVPRGHILGGSTALNGMTYARGSAADYNRWADVTGDSGWSWNNMLPYFLKSEKWSPPADNHDTTGQYDPAFHSTQGVVGVSLGGFPEAADAKVMQASAELSGDFAFEVDGNDGIPLGWMQSTIAGGERQTAATTYLSSTYASRPNLHVLVDHLVTKISPVGHGNKPSFRRVSFRPRREDSNPGFQVTAKKEVILSAGSYGTPQLLLLSGIGDPTDLAQHSIETIVNLPSVGKNLTDHPSFNIVWQVNNPNVVDPSQDPALQQQFLDEWLATRTGPLTHLVINTVGWTRLPDNSPLLSGIPNPSAGPNSPHIEISFRNAGYYPNPGPQLSVHCSLATPLSRGTVKISSANILDQPLIDWGMLTDPFDITVLRECARQARTFVSAEAFDDYDLTITGSFAGVDLDDDAAVDAVLRNIVADTAHPVTTAAMSPAGAQYGVVDPDLKVKKVRHLRVVDASIMPYIPVGNTQAPVYAIAERAADLIKASCAHGMVLDIDNLEMDLNSRSSE
ncbi:hypothetical protein NMY22_g10298 [Coprinellus aureogranulatus]|nr:hypothetical protein NMY22_g10298 [Coprinellus aureogranulatus]